MPLMVLVWTGVSYMPYGSVPRGIPRRLFSPNPWSPGAYDNWTVVKACNEHLLFSNSSIKDIIVTHVAISFLSGRTGFLSSLVLSIWSCSHFDRILAEILYLGSNDFVGPFHFCLNYEGKFDWLNIKIQTGYAECTISLHYRRLHTCYNDSSSLLL